MSESEAGGGMPAPDVSSTPRWLRAPDMPAGAALRLTTVIREGGLTPEVFDVLRGLLVEDDEGRPDGLGGHAPGPCPHLTYCGVRSGSCPELTGCGTYSVAVLAADGGDTLGGV